MDADSLASSQELNEEPPGGVGEAKRSAAAVHDLTDLAIDGMNQNELRAQLKNRNQKASGSKLVLNGRLKDVVRRGIRPTSTPTNTTVPVNHESIQGCIGEMGNVYEMTPIVLSVVNMKLINCNSKRPRITTFSSTSLAPGGELQIRLSTSYRPAICQRRVGRTGIVSSVIT